eukprot:scaffold10.g2262.t1
MILVSESIDDFYLSEEALAASPSRGDGVLAETEAELRRYGCDCIQEAGILLRLPQVVMATAQVLLHRFYCKRSMQKFDVKVAAIAAFWLGCKLEEVIEIDKSDKLSLRSVITVFFRVTRRRDGASLRPMDPYCKVWRARLQVPLLGRLPPPAACIGLHSPNLSSCLFALRPNRIVRAYPPEQEYEQTKAAVVAAERHMLRAFGFIIHVEHPHRFVLNYGQMLGLPRVVQQEAWNLANDSLRTPLCVCYKAEVVACGILFCATRRLGVSMPEDPAWWELFEVERRQLYDVCHRLSELYRQPRPQYVCLQHDVTAGRATAGGASPAPPTAAATPLRSPTSAGAAPASAAVSLAATASVAGQERRSDGETEQRKPDCGPTSSEPRRGGEGGAQPATSQATTATRDSGRERDRDARKRSRSRSRSSQSRSRSRERRRSRSRSRDRHSRKQRWHYGNSRSRSRSRDRHRGGGSRHDRYSGRPPRDDRRNTGAHRPPALGLVACAWAS